MAISNLTGQKTSKTFQNLMQISSSGQVYDGLGNLVTFLQLTSSFVSGSTGGTGAGFPFTGSALITGSLGITGSLDLSHNTAASNGISVTGHIPRLLLINSGSGATAAGGVISAKDNNFTTKAVNSDVFSISATNEGSSVVGRILFRKASNDSTNILFNNSGASTAIYISGSGNVGIRTTTPTSASLHVSGNIWASSFTGSLLGTASFAISSSFTTQALSASWAQNSISSSYPLSVTGTTLRSTYVTGGTGASTINGIFIGSGSGQNATNANNSNFLGRDAGNGATNAFNSNFLGQFAGTGSVNAYYSNFLGSYSGFLATNAFSSNFIGYLTGQYAVSASNSNFLGTGAGFNASNASSSNFFGTNAGSNATNAIQSNFFGTNAGRVASNATYSTLIGFQVGYDTTGGSNSIGSNNIIIGTNITLAAQRRDSINLGGIIFATGSYSNIATNPYSGSQAGIGRVGINVTNPNYTLDVSGSVNFTGDIYQNGTPFQNAAPVQEKYMWYSIRIQNTNLLYNNPATINPNQASPELKPGESPDFNTLLPYTYVDIIDQTNNTTYTSLTFTDISDIITYITNNSITYGHVVIYSIKNNTGNLRVGGVNLFSTQIAVRGRLGKVSSKRSYDVDTGGSVYSTLTQALSSSLVTDCSSIVPNFSTNYINQDQVEAIVAAPNPNDTYTYFSFTSVNKYKKRQFSRHYVGRKDVGIDEDGNAISLSNPDQAKVLGIAVYEWYEGALYFRTFVTNYGYSSQSRERLGPQNTGGSMLNIYIVQTSDNCRALVVEPIGIDRILTPPSFDKISETHLAPILPNITIYRKGNVTQVADYEARVDNALGISTYLPPELFSHLREKPIHEVDVINLYSDRTCDLFEKAIKLDKLKYTPKKYINLTLLNSNYQKN